jgi:septum formation protein
MHKIVLASQSPRRKQLMEAAEIDFEIIIADVDETNPPGMANELVPEHLAQKKAAAIEERVHDAIIVAADTVVILDHEILGKPTGESNAREILAKLSGRTHQVITGVCIQKGQQKKSFSTVTEVSFRELTAEQTEHYVSIYKPYDKAGAYAIQEWIGMIGIKGINGDYYNVMGLPIGEVVLALKEFTD